ncbi:Pyruvate kinase, cytosolic isozyme [Hibiscus syriacus]|uniref:Pyruvate kinase n=1 Tax=Hibiscus syriacus TaxID=106335 RepID=A0A6A2Y3Z4_HIBSY|nr:Pyruvate kinase, cytosolic isozyme [Hibiscus syriacus]
MEMVLTVGKGNVRPKTSRSVEMIGRLLKAVLGERKNVNLPGVVVDLPTLTDKEKEDIFKVGCIYVARVDLGMETPIEKIFLAQKLMILKANIQGKPVVTATQMLESMIRSPRATRAEATDVANAVLDGTDCVMLRGETAAGSYPDLAVQTMARICMEAENFLNYGDLFKRIMETAPMPMSPLESLASSAVSTASCIKASLILVLTRGGTTAKLVAKGLIPVLSSGSAKASYTEPTEEATKYALQYGKENGLIKPGDSVVALRPSVIKILTKKCSIIISLSLPGIVSDEGAEVDSLWEPDKVQSSNRPMATDTGKPDKSYGIPAMEGCTHS